MAWYDKYVSGQAGMGGNQYTPEQAVGIRQMEFDQRMAERKAMDKYERKKDRYERLRNRPRGSFKQKRKRAHWNWLADLEQKSPQAAAYYRHTQDRKRAEGRWRAEQRRRRRAATFSQRSAGGDKAKQQWVGQMGGAQGSRHREYPGPMPAVKVGKSGAPQFMSLASMGYKSPGQLGFKTYTGQPNYRYTPRGTSARGGRRRSQGQGEGQAERYFDWDTMQWVTPQEPKKKKERGPRQAPRAWAEHQELLGRPSDYRTYLADRRLRMSTGLQDPMGSAISAGQQAAGMVGQGIDRINPNRPGNIFHSAGQWLGGMAPSGPKPLLDPMSYWDRRSGAGLVPVDRPEPTLPPGPRPKPPTSSHGIGVGGFLPASPPPLPPSNFYPDASTAPPALPWETPVELPPGTTYEDIRPPKRTSLPDDHPLLAPDPVMPWLRQMYGAAGEDLKDKWGRIYDLFARNYSW